LFDVVLDPKCGYYPIYGKRKLFVWCLKGVCIAMCMVRGKWSCRFT